MIPPEYGRAEIWTVYHQILVGRGTPCLTLFRGGGSVTDIWYCLSDTTRLAFEVIGVIVVSLVVIESKAVH